MTSAYRAELISTAEVRSNKNLQKKLLSIITGRNRLMGSSVTDNSHAVREFAGLLVKKTKQGFDSRFHTWALAYHNDETDPCGFFVCGSIHDLPIWTIQSVSFANAQKRNDWSKGHPFVTTLDALGDKMISDRVYDLMWMQPDRPAIRKQWKSGFDMMHYCPSFYDSEKQQYKWHRYIEGVVKQGETHPIEQYHKQILQDRPALVDVAIRHFVLKNEYRQEWNAVSDWWPNND